MSRTLNVVTVCGSLRSPSRTQVLVDRLVSELRRSLAIDVQAIHLAELGPQLTTSLHRDVLSPEVDAKLRAIESADLLIAATPVYRASFTGLFKHVFDLVDRESLIDVPVLLAATGGTERHALVIDHQLRPLFAFFQARTLPLGVYASEADFAGHEIASPQLQQRIEQVVAHALPLIRTPSAARRATAAAA